MTKVSGVDLLPAKSPGKFAAVDGLTNPGRIKMAASLSSRIDEAAREIASRTITLREEKAALRKLARCRRDVGAFGRSEISLLDLLERQPDLFHRGGAARIVRGESQEGSYRGRLVAVGSAGGLCGGSQEGSYPGGSVALGSAGGVCGERASEIGPPLVRRSRARTAKGAKPEKGSDAALLGS
jgi:hypothetical protein